jgi:GNAT superfamily N-acetyltransferase
MTSEVTVRPAREADVPLIVSLIHALAEYEKAAPGAVSLTDDLLRDALFGAHPSVEGLIAETDSSLAGYALFFHNFSSWRGRRGLYLEDLFVRPELRGRGIGKALMQELARIATARGCARIEWVVIDWNTPAIGFYKSLGAEPIDGWTIYRLNVPIA